MNHFTKEELQELKRCLKYMTTGGTTPYSVLTMALSLKVQLMINTYSDDGIKSLKEHLLKRLEILEELAKDDSDSEYYNQLLGHMQELKLILIIFSADTLGDAILRLYFKHLAEEKPQ